MGLGDLSWFVIGKMFLLFMGAGTFYILVIVMFWALCRVGHERIFCQGLRYRAFIISVVFGVAFASFIIYPALRERELENVVARVVWKEHISTGLIIQNHRYLIYTVQENGEPLVFADADNYLHQKHNSSEIYALIELGKWYRFALIGNRVPFFQNYPNMVYFEGPID